MVCMVWAQSWKNFLIIFFTVFKSFLKLIRTFSSCCSSLLFEILSLILGIYIRAGIWLFILHYFRQPRLRLRQLLDRQLFFRCVFLVHLFNCQINYTISPFMVIFRTLKSRLAVVGLLRLLVLTYYSLAILWMRHSRPLRFLHAYMKGSTLNTLLVRDASQAFCAFAVVWI